jgi:aspartyl-tRNA(Asn)/glutamyl-tRNA(Gln) amidotransferase subunit C
MSAPPPQGRTALPASLSLSEVRLTAAMARLHLDEPQLLALAEDLGRFLDYAARLAEVDITGVEPTSHALPLGCPLREDVVGAELPAAVALAAAPAAVGSFFSVPAVLPVGPGDGGGR